MNLSGKILAVTGSDGALGQAVAEVLSGYGAKLALLSHSTAFRGPLPAGTLHFGGVDLTLEEAGRSVMDRLVKAAGRLDGLVNIAGGFGFGKFAGGGRIVNVGSAAAGKATAGMGAYAASKAGVAKLTEALADELKDQGITVNAVLPSILDTPKNRIDMPKADFTRWVTPAEAAEVVAFLISDQARAITGALIPVGGRV
jgi:NAD(P)-dependent dehydrogenase (short-subunit alcohol dehydrogenase family)